MPLILIGVNHRTAPVAVRERMSVADAQLAATLDELKVIAPIDGVALLSTCNRVEVILSAEREDVIEAFVDWAWDGFSKTGGPHVLDRGEAAVIDWEDDDAVPLPSDSPAVTG